MWARHEYELLPRFDGEIGDQALAGAFSPFGCHSSPEQLCAGWVGHRDHPDELLAIRIGLIDGDLDPAVADYTTDVPLWPTGAAAAEHGLRDLDAPGPEAQAAIDKLVQLDPGRLAPGRRAK